MSVPTSVERAQELFNTYGVPTDPELYRRILALAVATGRADGIKEFGEGFGMTLTTEAALRALQ